MKLRGESGGIPARMGGVSGTFTPRAKSVAKKAISKKSSSVKVVPKKDMTTRVVDNINATSKSGWLKSGVNASGSARLVDIGKPNATIKINSGSKPKPISAATKKANAKALKAANKKK